MPTNARVNVQKDNVTDALSSSVVVPTGKALTIASGGSLTAQAGSIVSIPASGITGLGTMATQNANNVAITGGSITGITDLAVADGGTGTSSLTGYVKGAGTTPLTASSTIPNTDITGLGTMSTQNANNVAVTGGSITGITDLAVADGGTGASNAADARVNLGVSTTGTSILYGDGAGSFSNVTIGSGVSFTGGTLSATGTGGTVTTVSVTTANGVSGTVTNPTTTPAISLTLGAITPTSVNSVTLSGSATPTLAVTGASTVSGTNTGDQTISITGDVTAAGSQNTLTSTVTRINGQALSTLATGILKNTTSTGVPSIAVAADFPTLNQNTTGNAATATNVAVTGVTGLGTGVASFLQTPTSANLSSMVVDETGSGNLVFANSPVLVTPNLDTPSVLTLTNATGLPLSSGVTGTLPVANGGTGVTTSTGTGSTVLSDSPTLTGIPAAPTAAVGTNTTQIATTQYVQSNRGDKYLTTSNSTNTINNANGKVFNCAVDLSYIPTQPVTIVYDANHHMHGFVVSYNITTGVMVVDIDSHTGTGTYSAWTINIGGLTSVGGALLSANNLSDVASVATSRANLGVTATGQDTTYLYRINNLSDLDSVSTARTNLGLGTMATQNSTNVSISGGTLASVTLTTPTISSITNTGTLTLPNQTDTLVGRATTDVLTNKTLTSPVMTTPSLGVASATSINKVAITAPATGSTLTIADGATLTASATATVSGTNTGDQTISITGDVTASGSTGVLTSTVTKINGTSLAGLATGILKNTTGTGVPSIAVSGSDYAPATFGSSILYGNGAGGFSNVTIGSGVAFSGGTLSATGNGGTVTSVSVTTANGVSGTVANPTTTPAISLTLGAITPTSITTTGNVGIGVTNPQQLLAVGSITDQVGAGVSGVVSTLYFGVPSNSSGGIARLSYDRSTGSLNFISNTVASPVTTMALSAGGLAITGATRIMTNNVYYAGTTTSGANQNLIGIGADDNTAIVSKSGNTIKMDASGSTVGTFSAAGLAIIGTLSATGLATFGAGGTGTNSAGLILSGGSGSAGGGYLTWHKNAVASGYVGSVSSVFGGTSNDTLLYSVSNNIVFRAGSAADILTVTTSGNVGIGVTPGAKLDVKGLVRSSIGTGTGAGGAAYAFYEFGTSATATENWHIGSEGDGSFRFYNQGFGAGLERMRITAAGNVGIGTTSPSAKLSVVTSASDTVATFTRTGGNNCYITMTGGSASDYTYEQAVERTAANSGNAYFGGAANTTFSWRQGGYSQLMRLDSTNGLAVTGGFSASGSAGFGCTSAAAGSIARITGLGQSSTTGVAVAVAASDYLSTPTYTASFLAQNGNSQTGTTCGLSNAGLGSLYFQNTSAAVIWSNGSAPIVFGVQSVERMRISNDGNVGIGTSSAQARLQVTTVVDGAQVIVRGAQTSNNQFLLFRNGYHTENTTAGLASVGWQDTGGAGGNLFLATTANASGVNGTPTIRLFVSQNGNVGIGNTNPAYKLDVTGSINCSGALSKGSGSFRIEHPLPEKSATHQLVHSFIEGPQADLIYRGKVALVDGKASVNIDTAATMTEGTFEVLCRDVQCFTTNETGWTAVRGKVTGNILTIEAKDADCVDEISWMVIGERKDAHMMETDWTDDNGKVIVEPLKPVTESK